VWRVTLSGRFPPRALRYVVLADRRPIAFGVPTSNARAVRAITTDRAVLSARLTAAYGSRPSVPATPITEPPASQGGAGIARSGPASDPASAGPLAVQRSVYDLGDEVFQPSGLTGKVELTGDVHYPADLSGGPYPLVVFMHGNHVTCYKGRRADYRWPCKPGWQPIPNYGGYDYIARDLASYGFIVVSISANGVNVLGNRVPDTGMRQRGEVLEKHIDLWKEWATTGGEPFGTTFVGKVDLTRIGTMGHSRGGEGVVWNVIVDRERPDPYGIDAVLALAPVDFTRVTINEVPFAVVLPYCDGDVSDLEGIHYFDDSRYLVPGDATPKHTVTAFGANHNFFNTVWTPGGRYPGGFDDGRFSGCDDRLRPIEERHVGRAYIVSFFRRYLTDATEFEPIWTGEQTPASIAPARVLVSYLAPDLANRRLDVDRFTGPGDLSVGQTGGAVTAVDTPLFGWCEDGFDTPCMSTQYAFSDVHMSFPFFFSGEPVAPGLGQAMLGWSGEGSVRFAVPSSDVSAFDALQFRATINPAYFANDGAAFQDLSVVLEDGDGHRAEVSASDVGNDALANPVGRRRFGHIILNQVRFPLGDFAGVDLTDVVAVELHLDRTIAGVIDLADLAFSADAV
jgi:hypothetical protein